MKNMHDATGFRAQARRLVLVWLALLGLLALTCGCAYLRLGSFNLVAALLIAAAKIALIALCFMRLGRASGWSRASAAVALLAAAVLGAFFALEAGTRGGAAAPYQPADTLHRLPSSTAGHG